MPSTYILEIATSDYSTTRSAVEGGADRIELCANLVEGGTTASFGTIKRCREDFTVQLFPIIRPRGGDFLYSEEEYGIMRNDVVICKELGCDGIVIGLLDANGNIDLKRTAELIEFAYPLEVTFHRAFDRCRDPFEALEQLVQIGCQRILTSGQKPSVSDGVELVTKLNERADGRIVIMPGSGVRKDNIRMLAEKTGCNEFHSSLRGKTSSRMQFMHPSFAGSEDSYMNNHIEPAHIKELRNALS
jgi:copper homeostasis protein